MGVRYCSHLGCTAVVDITKQWCEVHEAEHAEDGKPRPRREFRQKRRGGLQKHLTDEERAEKRANREKREAERRARQLEVSLAGPAKPPSSGGGGKPVTNPNSKKAQKARRKEGNKKRSRKKS